MCLAMMRDGGSAGFLAICIIQAESLKRPTAYATSCHLEKKWLETFLHQ